MATDLMTENTATENALLDAVEHQGHGSVHDVALPATFQPAIADVALIRVGETTEVFIGANARYTGDSSMWRSIMSSPSISGAHLVGRASGGARAGLRLLRERLASAGDTPVGPQPGQPSERGVVPDENELIAHIATKVIGQMPSVITTAKKVRRHVARVAPSRPMSLLLVGSSGVGKTTMMHAIPAALRELGGRGSDYMYLHVPLNERTQSHESSVLFGAPPGYVGYQDTTPLTAMLEASRGKAVVGFDEIERAHPTILTALFNAIDRGEVTTPRPGEHRHVLDCRPAIFVLATNLASEAISEQLDSRSSWDDPAVVDDVCRRQLVAAGLPAPFIGRMTACLAFAPLDDEARSQITELSIHRAAAEYGLSIVGLDSAVVARTAGLLDSGGDFGSRPDQYRIDDLVGDVFIDAASDGHRIVTLTGPPYECRPVAGAE